MVLGHDAYDSSYYDYELFAFVVESLMVIAWSLYCSWHLYGWGLLARYMDDYSKLHWWRHDDDEFLPIWCRLMILVSCKIWMAMVFLTYDRIILFKRMSWYGHTLMIHALIQVVGLVADDSCYGADYTMLLLMFIMILFRCLVFVINVMYIIRCKGHIKTHDVIVCLYLL